MKDCFERTVANGDKQLAEDAKRADHQLSTDYQIAMSLMERRDKLAEAVKRPKLRDQMKRMLGERLRAVRSSREQQEMQLMVLDKKKLTM